MAKLSAVAPIISPPGFGMRAIRALLLLGWSALSLAYFGWTTDKDTVRVDSAALANIDAMFSREALFGGAHIDRAGCERLESALWVNALGENFCVRYYLAPGRAPSRNAIAYLHEDVTERDYQGVNAPASYLRELAASLAGQLAHGSGLTGIFLARIGVFGSSGQHRDRHTLLEVTLANAALDTLRRRHDIEKFHVVGHGGGSDLAVALMTLRTDFGCVVLGAGTPFQSSRYRQINKDRAWPRILFDTEAIAATAGAWVGRPILVVSDPRDTVAPFHGQAKFVHQLRERGRAVEQIIVSARDSEHHDVARQAIDIMQDCASGLSPAAIVKRHQAPDLVAANGLLQIGAPPPALRARLDWITSIEASAQSWKADGDAAGRRMDLSTL